MSFWDVLKTSAEKTEEQYNSFSDPDGYFFPKIDEAISSGDPTRAKNLLEEWRGKKLLKYKQENRSVAETVEIQNVYQSKLSQIMGSPPGPLGMDRSVVITLLIAIGVVAIAWPSLSKGFK